MKYDHFFLIYQKDKKMGKAEPENEPRATALGAWLS